MQTYETDEDEIDLLELWYVVRAKLWMILAVGVFCGALLGFGSKMLLTPKYTSTTQLYILNKNQSLNSLSLSDLQIGSQLTKDYMILVKSRPVLEQVIDNLDLDLSYGDLREAIALSNPQDTRILQIQVEYTDPYMAKQIVDEVANVSVKRISEIMDISEPNIVEEGVISTIPSSPHIKKNALIGALAGMVLVTGIIIASHLLDDTIRSSEDIEKRLHIATLGTIPLQNGMNGANEEKSKKKRNSNKKASR